MNPVHDKNAFRIGQRVIVAQKVVNADNWIDRWNDVNMDRTVGQAGVVINTSPAAGFQVLLDNTRDQFWYPSCALAPGRGAGPLGQKNVAPPKRVRVTAGPWDAAPCPHLRWHLMGFFREKLKLEKTQVTINGVAGQLAEVTVECTKCRKSLKLTATTLAG
jgi:hypothetical protein